MGMAEGKIHCPSTHRPCVITTAILSGGGAVGLKSDVREDVDDIMELRCMKDDFV